MNFDIRYVSNLNNSMLFKINTNFYGNGTSITENNLIKFKKCTLFESQCIQHEQELLYQLGTLFFYVSYWTPDCLFTCSSEPRKGQAVCGAKEVPSFLSYFKTLSIGPAQGIEPTTSRSAVKRSTD